MTESRQHFPETHQTFVIDALDSGRDRELASHIMLVYYEPLCVYYRGTSYRSLGEAEEIIGGFFASRLSDPGWLARWRAEAAERPLPLRRWLMNGLCFYLREESRRQRRDRSVGPLESAVEEDAYAELGLPRPADFEALLARARGEEMPAKDVERDARRPRASRWLRAGISSALERIRRRRGQQALDDSIRRQFAERAQREASLEGCTALERRYEAERARRLLALAVDRTRAVCVGVGQSLHFEIFMRHHVQCAPYELIAPEFTLNPTQCAGMARTAGAKFRAQLCAILLEEGVDPHDMDQEIARLQEALEG